MGEPKALVNVKRKYNGWSIGDKLDEGGFGVVFRCTNDKETAAFKAESRAIEGGSAIKLEMAILTLLNKEGEVPHAPFLFHAAKRSTFCYMIVTLLGKNLRSLKSCNESNTLSMATWSRLCLQALYGIKLLHDIGFVHRDIKPANFMMGRDEDVPRARLVHIIDFGLSRSYAFRDKITNKFVPRRARPSVEFRGTLRYCSPNVHLNLEQSRRDDLFSLLYMCIELARGLPWQSAKDKHTLEKMKFMSDDQLLEGMPREMFCFLDHIKKIDMYNRPDYAMIANVLKTLAKKSNATFATPYDWEIGDKKTLGSEILRKRQKPLEYELDTYYESDPVGLDKPPATRGTGLSDVAGQNTTEDNRSKLISIQNNVLRNSTMLSLVGETPKGSK